MFRILAWKIKDILKFFKTFSKKSQAFGTEVSSSSGHEN